MIASPIHTMHLQPPASSEAEKSLHQHRDEPQAHQADRHADKLRDHGLASHADLQRCAQQECDEGDAVRYGLDEPTRGSPDHAGQDRAANDGDSGEHGMTCESEFLWLSTSHRRKQLLSQRGSGVHGESN